MVFTAFLMRFAPALIALAPASSLLDSEDVDMEDCSEEREDFAEDWMDRWGIVSG